MKIGFLEPRYRVGLKLLSSCLSLIVLATNQSAGQDAKADLSELSLEQLTTVQVYTASRHLQSVGDAPSSVTLITAQQIQEHGYRTLADVLRTVRGFFVTYDRNYSSLGVRGFARPGDFNTRILLLVDGHRLNDNIYDDAMIGTEFPIDIDLIQRIEIIRGPVSSLYGSNALFAVINIFTKQGRDLQGLQLSSGEASYNTTQGRISYGRRLGQIEFLISGSFYGSRGQNSLFYPEYDTPETNNGIASHANDDQLGSALATISFHDLTLRSAYGTREKGIPTGAYGTIFDNSGTRTTDSHGYIDLQYQHTLANTWSVEARSFYDRYTYEGTYEYPSPVSATQVSPELDFADGKWWGGEAQVGRTILGRNRVVGGVEYRDNFRQNQTTYDLNPYALQLADKRTSYVAAEYLQDEVTLTKNLDLDAVVRYDHYSSTHASIDPRVALVFRPRSGTAIKLIYGEAFRAPNVYEMYYSVAPNAANPALNPEKIRTTELVWEQELPLGVTLSTSGFYSRMHGLITQMGNEDGSLVYRNLQDVKSSGVEAELRGQVLRGPDWVASYGFQEAVDGLTDQLLNNSPRSLAKLNFTEPFAGKRLVASVDAQYRSRIESATGSEVSPFTVVNVTLLGRQLGRHLDLSASVYNALDKHYSDPGSGSLLEQQVSQDGRSVRIKMYWSPAKR